MNICRIKKNLFPKLYFFGKFYVHAKNDYSQINKGSWKLIFWLLNFLSRSLNSYFLINILYLNSWGIRLYLKQKKKDTVFNFFSFLFICTFRGFFSEKNSIDRPYTWGWRLWKSWNFQRFFKTNILFINILFYYCKKVSE